MNIVFNLNGPVLLLIALPFYAYFAYSLQTIAKKTNTPYGWLAWIPLANIFLMLSIAEFSSAWMLLLLVPYVLLLLNTFIPLLVITSTILAIEIVIGITFVILNILIWMKMSTALGKSPLVGLLILVPVVNFFLIGYLAFSDSSIDNTSPSMSTWQHPELQTGEVFIANYTQQDFENRVAWKTKRLGQVAYDREGKKEINTDLHPVFAQKSEMVESGII